jgi:DNA mismatch endonuclease (patch repair protein)
MPTGIYKHKKGIYHHSEETLQKMRKPKSEEGRKNMRLAKLGKPNKNKGKTLEEILGIERAIDFKRNSRKPKSEDFKRNLRKPKSEEAKRRMRKPKSEEGRKNMRLARLKKIIPFKDTSIEVRLQNILRDNNIIFEKHKPIHGQPDLFIEPNICIFADGDYWHNYPAGRERDREVTKVLTEKGYKVLRFWEHDINNNLNDCFEQIRGVIDF